MVCIPPAVGVGLCYWMAGHGDGMCLASVPAPTQSSRPTAPTRPITEGAVRPSRYRPGRVAMERASPAMRTAVTGPLKTAILRQWRACGCSVRKRLTFAPGELTVGAVYRFRGGGSPERGPRGLRTRSPAGIEAAPGDAGLPWMDSLLSAFPDFPHRGPDRAEPNPSAIPEPTA